MASFTIRDGRNLSYECQGEGAPLVCHPGGPGIPGALFGDLGGLARSCTIVALDPRGVGESDPPSSSAYALVDYVSDLNYLQTHLGLDRINLLGHSHGSFVALLYAARYPHMVERLILIAAGSRYTEKDLKRMNHEAQLRSGEPWFDDASAALQAEQNGQFSDDTDFGRLLARMLPFYFANYGQNEQAFASLAFQHPAHAAAKRYFDARELLTFDLRPCLANITAPTLLIAGQEDFIHPPAMAREIAAGIADARVTVLDGVGHFPWVEQPDEFVQIVCDFLT